MQGSGVVRIDEKQREVSVRLLIHDHRQIVQTQLLVRRELLITPAARATLSNDQPLDLVGMLAQAASAETTPVEAESVADTSQSDT